MTSRRISAQLIVDQHGACLGVFCGVCPIHAGCTSMCDRDDYNYPSDLHKNLAQAYLDSLEPAEPPKQKPTTEETEHPSELEIQKRATEILDNALAADPSRGFTQSDVNDARNMSTASCQLELLWDIRELLKHSLDQSYCVEQAINNAGR